MSSPTVSVTGPEAQVFLNNLLTQELLRDPARPLRYGALLTPQGKVITDLLIWRIADGYLLDPLARPADDLALRLSRFKLRAKVDIAVLDHAPALAPQLDPRLPGLGERVPGVKADPAALIKAGAPDLGADAGPEEVFALEALLEELNGVDFQKGCFPGQENVSRMKRRATTRKKFCRIAFDGPAPAVATPISAGAAELGTVRSGIDGAAIALLRLDRALEAADKGELLMAGRMPVRLDPPDWLILPAKGEDS
jgi:tRNA-modifying protein YgfZ